MSDDQQPEEMRPIPDGGLKDAMPSWLKRPPAWRSMPSAEQRHERTLPEPDTSEIDPKTLVEVGDLPPWLQAIAERNETPLPEPDQAVGHALEQLQAASSRTKVEAPAPGFEKVTAEPETTEEPPTTADAPELQEVVPLADEPTTTLPQAPESSNSPWLIWSLVACGVIMVALAAIIFYLI